MKSKYALLLINAVIILFLAAGCAQENGPANNSGNETTPVISSITADKTQILYGGEDMATITCDAIGGNLKYVWQVDLGDLVPKNSERSQVSFTGAACCVGAKIITCTVSNSMGSVSKSITINIIENITVPEIITIESDKTEINSANSETAALVCYALGGNLKYAWEADCGSITVNPADNSKITYAASAECIGTRNIKCTVSNEKGSVSIVFQMAVK